MSKYQKVEDQTKSLRTDRLDGPKGMQEHLRMEGIDMSLGKDKEERYAWAKKYRNYTLTDWRQWVIFDETRVNMWGTDGNSFSCITATGPGYGITIIDASIDSSVYVDIFETSLLDTLDYVDLHIEDVRFQQDRATSRTSVITKQWFNKHGFSVDTIMNWPARSPNLNPIKHVWY
ncbi:hypothetical protein INT46_002570 [Mucor plumbeus]|uniref:Tc1-like transposase DDE domain-containing protein n=1 Tax=Mucor plumbeus TaxID=97098 RepID=A0A8H7UP02_9FUNG|nr:hypothetical protein INT46_002570 [Mucor plumbeus]